jgi:putative transposase
VSLLNYCITMNHVHLLAVARDEVGIPALMQRVQGQFAGDYNRRRRRSGAFWNNRYHCTMVESGRHLWNCATYIDLNMVRAGAVKHPREWRWCGYDELTGRRKRYRLLDRDAIAQYLGQGSLVAFGDDYEAAIADALARRRLKREPYWTESLAVGGHDFVDEVASHTDVRIRLEMEEGSDGVWTVREVSGTYGLEAQAFYADALGPNVGPQNRF